MLKNEWLLAGILVSATLCQTATADAVRKCLINGKTVYSDNLCKNGAPIDTLNATPPSPADVSAARIRNARLKQELELKEAENSRVGTNGTNCIVLARSAEWSLAMSQKYPHDIYWRAKASADVGRLNQACPNKIVISR